MASDQHGGGARSFRGHCMAEPVMDVRLAPLSTARHFQSPPSPGTTTTTTASMTTPYLQSRAVSPPNAGARALNPRRRSVPVRPTCHGRKDRPPRLHTHTQHAILSSSPLFASSLPPPCCSLWPTLKRRRAHTVEWGLSRLPPLGPSTTSWVSRIASKDVYDALRGSVLSAGGKSGAKNRGGVQWRPTAGQYNNMPTQQPGGGKRHCWLPYLIAAAAAAVHHHHARRAALHKYTVCSIHTLCVLCTTYMCVCVCVARQAHPAPSMC